MELLKKLKEWNENEFKSMDYFKTKQQRAHEDRFQACKILNNEVSYYAVFDGHGGLKENHTVDYCTSNLHVLLEKHLSKLKDRGNEKSVKIIIEYCFLYLDRLAYNKKLNCGCTCCLLLIDHKYEKVFIVNLGDSRCICFSPDGTIKYESKDHTPISEKVRIEATLMATVHSESRKGWESSYLAIPNKGGIRVSRSFGDFQFKSTRTENYHPTKGAMSAFPVIDCMKLKKNRIFLLSTDGAFDMNCRMTSQELVDGFFVCTNEETMIKNVENAVEAVSQRTTDDVTIGIVLIK